MDRSDLSRRDQVIVAWRFTAWEGLEYFNKDKTRPHDSIVRAVSTNNDQVSRLYWTGRQHVIVCQTVTPDGKFLYIGSVTNFSGSLVSIDLPGGTAAGPAVQSRNPEAIAITPNGSYAYVSTDDSVIVIDISPE